MQNARHEGVADRIKIQTGDARALPIADERFDVVLSRWMVPNLESDHDQRQALDEMWRVVRPGGVMVLADIAHTQAYLYHLAALGAVSCDMLDGGFEARVMGCLTARRRNRRHFSASSRASMIPTERFRRPRERTMRATASLDRGTCATVFVMSRVPA
jgi:ubiquinone/menaquinone biosynthesis C-methylase UbiE